MSDKRQSVISENTLLSDMVKACLQQIKQLDKPWHLLGDKEQKRVIDLLEQDLRLATEHACTVINSNIKQTKVRCGLDKIAFKNGAVITLKVPKGMDGLHDLIDREGEAVDLIVTDIKQFLTSKGKPEADVDQKSLDLANAIADSFEDDAA